MMKLNTVKEVVAMLNAYKPDAALEVSGPPTWGRHESATRAR